MRSSRAIAGLCVAHLLAACRPDEDKAGPRESAGPQDSGPPADSGETGGHTGDDTGGGWVPEGPSSLHGKVWTLEGEPLAGATVKVGGRELSADEGGWFYLEDVAPGDLVLSVESEGYSLGSAVRTIHTGIRSYVAFSLVPLASYTWDPEEGDTLLTDEGVGIRFPVEGLLDLRGEPYVGPVEVQVALLRDADAIAAVPGGLMAASGEDVALLETVGAVQIRLYDEVGEPLGLAGPAVVSFPVADTFTSTEPAWTLFTFDEATGLWQETGGGASLGGIFEAEVERLGWLSGARFANTDQCVIGRLLLDGKPAAYATLSVSELKSLTRGAFFTDLEGDFYIELPAREEVRIQLEYGPWSFASGPVYMPETVAESRPEDCVDLSYLDVESQDEDDDGYPGETYGGPDCGDEDPLQHPGAPEIWYDGVDQDCDGASDYDQDEDGYESSAYGGEDCDDLAWQRNPGAGERCDDQDDNCSGDETDAEDAVTWYEDQDGDGAGDPGSAATSCEPPSDAVTDGADCDDLDATRYPGAGETCEDGVVNDCDGSEELASESCAPGGDYTTDDMSVALLGEEPGDSAGSAVSGPGDVDGDGLDDLLVGASGGGVVYLVSGVLLYDTVSLETATAEIGVSVGASTSALGRPGDLDGDGYNEVLVGAPAWETEGLAAGAALVFEGPLSGAVASDSAVAVLAGLAEGDEAGGAVSSAGDADGDGIGDLLVGARYDDRASVDAGAAWLILGPVSGARSAAEADATYLGVNAGEEAGADLAGDGDVDGDGLADRLIGAGSASGSAAWAAYLCLGPASGALSLADADTRFSAEEAGDGAGSVVAMPGDVDGDGLVDLAVGAPGNSLGGSLAGAAYLVTAPTSGDLSLGEATALLVGEDGGGLAGSELAGAGDLDADGLDDVLVGAPLVGVSGGTVGAVYVLFAPLSGTTEIGDADARLVGGGRYYGSSSDGVGDVDGNGSADLLIGAPYDDTAGSGAGAAYLLLTMAP